MSRTTALIAPLLLIPLGAAWADPPGRPASDLVRDLGSDDFKAREAAEKALAEAPDEAEAERAIPGERFPQSARAATNLR